MASLLIRLFLPPLPDPLLLGTYDLHFDSHLLVTVAGPPSLGYLWFVPLIHLLWSPFPSLGYSYGLHLFRSPLPDPLVLVTYGLLFDSPLMVIVAGPPSLGYLWPPPLIRLFWSPLPTPFSWVSIYGLPL